MQLVIVILGLVLLMSLGGIIALALKGLSVPQELGTVCIASLTGLGGLLAPNTGLVTSASTVRRARVAGEAAAAAVIADNDALSARHQDGEGRA